jgi:antitoxin PrlF
MGTMALAQSKVTAQGQISVPAEVRRKLGIGPGSVLEWDEQGDVVVVRRVTQYTSQDLHNAVFGSKPKARNLAALKQGIARHMKRRHARNRH